MDRRFSIALFGTAAILLAGVAADAQATRVKWSGLVGKNGDFAFLIPDGYQARDYGESNLATNPSNVVTIKHERVFSRYLNGVALTVEIYDGKASAINALWVKMLKLASVKKGTAGNFRFESFLNLYPDFT